MLGAETIKCPDCEAVGPNLADVRQEKRAWGQVISVGFKCTYCGHIWGHNIGDE